MAPKDLLRVVWPEGGTMFVIVGGIVSLTGDFASFLGNIASPQLLVWPFVALAGVLAGICLTRVAAADGHVNPPAAREAAIGCRTCDAFRVMFFASIGIVLLLLAGQGTTVSERLGHQLGLIQEDVTVIREDTAVIREDTATIRDDTATVREDTEVLRDISASAELVRDPKSAADFFHNAWVQSMIRRDGDGAWASLQAMYRDHVPNRLDAAELYATVGRNHLTRDQLHADMLAVGRERRDAAMLVIAGRQADSDEQAFALYEEARAIDPDQPFAYWDVARVQLMQITGTSATDNLAKARAAVAGHDRFLEVAGRKPVARYFFLPQHQPDFESLARTQRNSFEQTAQTWQRIADQQAEMAARARR